jgi:hypothetical protein
MESWWEYVQRVSGKTQQNLIAADLAAAGTRIDPSTVNRWANGQRPSADHAAAFSRAYGKKAAGGLLIAGYLKEDDMDEVVTLYAPIAEHPIDDLLNDIRRRLTDAQGKDDDLGESFFAGFGVGDNGNNGNGGNGGTGGTVSSSNGVKKRRKRA